MKVYPSDKVRNVAIVAHQGAGKTSLTEAMIYATGATSRLGKVDDGNTVADYFPEEIKRKLTVNATLVACEWKDHKINLLDVPGFTDFFGEVEGALRVADSLLMVLDAVAGVEVSTELIWELADTKELPIIAYINKMDRENADYYKAIASMKEKLSRHVIPLHIPIGKEASFKGFVDLLDEVAYQYENGKAKEIAIPADMADDVAALREELVEAAAEGDDELIMKYLDGEALTLDEIRHGLTLAVASAKVVPVLCGSALKNIGADKLLSALIHNTPSPLYQLSEPGLNKKPVAALVYKTMADPFVGKLSFFKVYQGTMKGDTVLYNANKELEEKISQITTAQGKNQLPVPEVALGDIGIVAKLTQAATGDTLTTKDSGVLLEGVEFSEPTYKVAITPKSKGDEDKLGNAMTRLLEEDPTLRYEKNVETHQTTLTGLGEAHINIVIERLQRKFGVEVLTTDLRIPYRETIRGTAVDVEGKHKKQSGGHGQYGHVVITMEPCEEDFVFEEKIFGGSVPKQYIPAVEKGIRESMVEGILAGYPVSNIKVTLTFGSYHDVDSSEMAFKIAANLAFKKACEQAKPILLEPVMDVEILVPDQFMGDIMGDMNSRGGRIMGMEKQGKLQLIKAQAPLSEMSRYSIDLKSITQGRGKFTMRFSRYDEVPAQNAAKIIAAAKAEKEKE